MISTVAMFARNSVALPPSTSYSGLQSVTVGVANNFAKTNSNALAWGPGKTLSFIVVADGSGAFTLSYVLACYTGNFAAGTGIIIIVTAAGLLQLVQYGPAGGSVTTLGTLPTPSGAGEVYSCAIRWSADTTTLSTTIKGSAILSLPAPVYTAPAAGSNIEIGYLSIDGANGLDGWARFVAMNFINRVTTDVELVREGDASNFDNDLILPLAGDASTVIALNASTYVSGATTWVSTGSAPLTLNKTGTIVVLDESNTLYDLRDQTNFFDTAPPITETGGNVLYPAGVQTWRRRTPFARYKFITNSPRIRTLIACTSYAAFIGNSTFCITGVDVAGGSHTKQIAGSDSSVIVGGVYPGFTGHAATLGGTVAPRTITLTDASQSDPTSPAIALVGTYNAKVRILAGRSFMPQRITAASGGRVICFLGDSIAGGGNCDDVTSLSALMLLRAEGIVEITELGAGYQDLFDWYNADPTYAYWNAQIALINPRATEIYWQVGRNGLGLDRWALLATLTAQVTAGLLALRAANPTAKIWFQCIGFCNDAAAAGNGFGQTLAQYRAAQILGYNNAVTAGLLNSAILNSVGTELYGAGSLDPDGIHLTTAGQATYKANLKVALGA